MQNPWELISKIMLSQKLYKTNWKIAIPYACTSVLTYAYKCCAQAYKGWWFLCRLLFGVIQDHKIEQISTQHLGEAVPSLFPYLLSRWLAI